MTVQLDQVADDLTGKVFGDLTVQHPLKQPSPGFSSSAATLARIRELPTWQQNKCSSAERTTEGTTWKGAACTPPEPPGLEHRIAACLQGGDISRRSTWRIDC